MPGFGQLHGFGHVGGKNTIDDEARRTHALQWQFADALDEAETDVQSILVGVFATNDLDQRQLGYGVEEVQPDKALRCLEPLAQLLQTNTRRVSGEQRPGRHLCLQRPVKSLLGLEILEDGFDNQVGPGCAGTFDV
jgi:hypothetical protein